MLKELLKSVGKEWPFQYMVLEENKNRTSSSQHIQRETLDVLKVKCKKTTIKVSESSVREYANDFKVIFLKEDTDTDWRKNKLYRFYYSKTVN